MIELKKDHSKFYKGLNYFTNFDQSQYNQTQKITNSAIDIVSNALSTVVPEPFSMIPTATKYIARGINNYINQPTQRNVKQFTFEKGNVYPIEHTLNSQQSSIPKIKKSEKLRYQSTFDLQKATNSNPNSSIQNGIGRMSPITEIFEPTKSLKKQDFKQYIKKQNMYTQRISKLLDNAQNQRVPSKVFVIENKRSGNTPLISKSPIYICSSNLIYLIVSNDSHIPQYCSFGYRNFIIWCFDEHCQQQRETGSRYYFCLTCYTTIQQLFIWRYDYCYVVWTDFCRY